MGNGIIHGPTVGPQQEAPRPPQEQVHTRDPTHIAEGTTGGCSGPREGEQIWTSCHTGGGLGGGGVTTMCGARCDAIRWWLGNKLRF